MVGARCSLEVSEIVLTSLRKPNNQRRNGISLIKGGTQFWCAAIRCEYRVYTKFKLTDSELTMVSGGPLPGKEEPSSP